MKLSLRTKLILIALTFAVALVATPNAHAGDTWGWKKPINQRLGAFYTLNKAFKRSNSSSSNSRYVAAKPSYSVTPTYSHVPAPTTTVAPLSIQQTHAQADSVPGQHQPMLAQNPSAPTSSTANSIVTPNSQMSPARTPVKPSQVSTLSVAERALELLGSEPVTDAGTPIESSIPTAETQGAERVESPTSPTTAEPLPFRSTSNQFWE